MGLDYYCWVYNRMVKRTSLNRWTKCEEKRKTEIKSDEWRGDEKCLELSRNLHNNGISGARANSSRYLARSCSRRSRSARLHFASLFLLKWQRHSLRSTAERETTARSSSIAPANSYTWNVDRCYLNCHGLTRATENFFMYMNTSFRVHEHTHVILNVIYEHIYKFFSRYNSHFLGTRKYFCTLQNYTLVVSV